MKKMNRLVMAAILAVALQGTAMADFYSNLDKPTDINIPTYASEVIKLGVDANSTLVTTGLVVNATVGSGISLQQQRTILFKLNGAVFADAIKDTDLTIQNATGPVETSITPTGGSVGSNYVYFEISPEETAIGQSDVANFILGRVKKVDDKNPITITYGLFQYGYQANDYVTTGATTGKYKLVTGTIAKFANAFSFTTTPSTQTADVSEQFKKFVADTGVEDNLLNAKMAEVTLEINVTDEVGTPATIYMQDSTHAATLKNLIADGSKIQLTAPASLASASKIYLDTTEGECEYSAADILGTVNGQTALFALNATNIDSVNEFNLCYQADGVTQMDEQVSFTLATAITPPTNVETANITGKNGGTILRNGTVLRAPFIEKSAFLHLTNTSSKQEAPYTVTCFGPNDAPFAGNGGTLAAGKTKKLWVGDLCNKDKAVNAVEFILDVPAGTVTGTFVRQNGSTGDTSADTMITK